MTIETSRLEGLTTATSYKAPVRLATTENITLSGLQTIDGVLLAEDDRILVKDQTDASQNGIYIATTGTWSRTADFNGARDVRKGTQVKATDGSANGGVVFEVTTDDTIVIGTSDITFSNEAVGSFDSVSPMNSVGDIIYGGASGTGTALDGSTSATKKFLSQQGDGANSAAPIWDDVSYNDLTDVPSLFTSPTTTKGDLIVRGTTEDQRLAAGTDGYVLTAQSTVSGGVEWSAVAAGGNDFNDNVFRVSDSDDTSRKIAFDAQDVSTGSTRTFRVPNQSDTIVGANSTQTLNNKTIVFPNITQINGQGTGVLNLPATNDTLVGRSTTDTLENKVIISPVVTGGNINSDTLQAGGNDVLTDADGLDSLNDVTITSVSDGDSLVYDTVTGGWINDTVAGGSGETNTASNTGAGAGVFSQKTGSDLEFNTIVAGANMTVAGGGAGSDVTITGAAAAGEVNTASNVGSGAGVFKAKSGTDLEFRSFVAGANTTITSGTDDVTIEAGGGSGDFWSDAVDSDIIPDTDSAYDLGSDANRFAQSFVDDRRGNFIGTNQNTTRLITSGDSLVNDFGIINPAITAASTSATSTGAVNYVIYSEARANSGTDAGVAFGGHAYCNGSNTSVWGSTINSSIGDINGVNGTQTGCSQHGLEIAVRDFGASGNSSFGIVMVAMGNHLLDSCFRVQSNLGGSGTSAQWQYGLEFENSVKDCVTDSYIKSSSGSATYGVNFQSESFGTAAINIENCSGTYGVRLTGSVTVGFEAGGSGTTGFRTVSGASYTNGFQHNNTGSSAGFHANGGGASAFQVNGASYVNGLYMVGATFTGGYEIRTDSLEVTESGAVGYPRISVEGSAGSLAGYVRHAYNGTVYKVPVYNL